MQKLTPEARARQSKMAELESLKKDIGILQDNLKAQLKLAQKVQEEYETKLSDFENEKEKKLGQALKKATSQVDEALATASAGSVLEKHRQLQQIKHELPQIIKAKPIQSSGPGQIQSAEEFSKKIPPGSRIFIPTLNQDGVVQSAPNARGEVLVLSQSIRLQVMWSELKPPLKSTNPTGQLVRQSGQAQVTFIDVDRQIDLRGKTVEVALSELEIALDRATEQNEDRIKIIHGHGTETLKKSIRTYLSRSVYVKKWKAGNSETGGDGVTWVELGQL